MRISFYLIGKFFCILSLLISCSNDKLLNSNFLFHEQQLYVRVPKELVDDSFIKNTDFNIDSKKDNEYIFGYISKNKIKFLDTEALQKIVILDQRYIHFQFDTKTLELGPIDQDFLENPYQGYHNYDQLTQTLISYANTYSNLVFLDSIGKSAQGRDIWVVKISDNPQNDENEPKFFYAANIHGDEPVGKELLLYLIDKFVKGYGVDPKITTIINNSQVYIIPSLNPDGFELKTRSNAYGYDLNRNFPDFITDPNDTYLGRQPETQAIMKFYTQNFFATALNFHGGVVCFNMPWDSTYNTPESKRFGDWKLVYALARVYADNNPTMYAVHYSNFDHGVTFGAEWMIIHGGLQDWAAYYRQSAHSTVELTNIKWPHYSYLSKHWEENKTSLVEFLYSSLLGLHILVTDRDENLIPQIKVKVSSSNLEITYNTPYINRPTINQPAQTAIISADGYKDFKLTFDPWMFDGTFKEIILEKEE